MISNDLNKLKITTPEGITFSFVLASPVTRALAWIVDSLLIVLISKAAQSVIGMLMIFSLDITTGLFILSYFLISLGYGILMEWQWRGQTIGKRILRLRVMDAGGLRLRFSQVVIRNLLRLIDSIPLYYMVGGIACLVSQRAQRLGDLAANTVVVWSPEIQEPDLDKLLSGKYNSLKNYPHLAARLRQKISPSAARVALQALLRRDELNPEARVQLFQELSDYFNGIVALPQEAMEGASKEQHVRNVVDVLYGAQITPP